MLHNGRKCIYNYQCDSRVCDPETNKCKGSEQGDSCSSHMQCNNGLACRASGNWPFITKCLPMADVGSACETDYDCKPRNFCWKLGADQDRQCLEKHSAPDKTQFLWDIGKYPEINVESLYAHGIFCQSGLAFRKSDNVAECVTIDEIRGLVPV